MPDIHLQCTVWVKNNAWDYRREHATETTGSWWCHQGNNPMDCRRQELRGKVQEEMTIRQLDIQSYVVFDAWWIYVTINTGFQQNQKQG